VSSHTARAAPAPDSYSVAALLYEVQAAVAAVIFRFKSDFASLPRLLWEPFEHIPNAARMLEEFPKWPDRDHNVAFRKVGLCGVVSLLAPDDEAPPTSVFLAGYSVGPLTGLLDGLLAKCGVPAAKVKALAKNIVQLAVQHGLECTAYGGKPCQSGRAGHYLQIFIRREVSPAISHAPPAISHAHPAISHAPPAISQLVDKYVYAALPYGVPDNPRQPLGTYLEAGGKQLKGQVRITANPDFLLQATSCRMFVFSADPTYHAKRTAFQAKLTAALEPILGDAATRTKAAKGICGGTLPEWWSSDDQGDAAKMAASRYATSTL